MHPAPSATSATSIRHIVLVKFKAESETATVAEVVAHFRRLPTEIPGLVGFEHGVNNSPEGKNNGLDHAFVLTFESAAARDGYLPHPAHLALVQRLRPAAEDVLVIDYAPD